MEEATGASLADAPAQTARLKARTRGRLSHNDSHVELGAMTNGGTQTQSALS